MGICEAEVHVLPALTLPNKTQTTLARGMHARLSSFSNISIDFLSSSVILRTSVLGTLSLTVVNCLRVFENDIIAILETKPYSVYHTQESRWGITFRRPLDRREKESPQVWIHLRQDSGHTRLPAPARPAGSPPPAWWAPPALLHLHKPALCADQHGEPLRAQCSSPSRCPAALFSVVFEKLQAS